MPSLWSPAPPLGADVEGESPARPPGPASGERPMPRGRASARRPRPSRPRGCARPPSRRCAGRGARRSWRRCRGSRRSSGWSAPRTSASRTSSSRSVRPAGSSRGRRATRCPAAASTASTASGQRRPSSASRSSCASAARRVERGPVRPRLAHRLVAVGGGEDAGRGLEPRRARPAVVAGAVEPLVVRAGQRADRGQRRRVRERALGEVRVQAHALPVAEPERPGLLPDRVRHADAAEVERQRGAPHARTASSGVKSRRHAAASASSATPSACPRSQCDLRSVNAATTPNAASISSPAIQRTGARLGGDRLVPDPRLVEPEEERVEVLERERGERRLVRRARAPLDHRARLVGAGGREEDRDVARHVQQPRGQRDRLAGDARREPVAVPALEDERQRLQRAGAEARASSRTAARPRSAARTSPGRAGARWPASPRPSSRAPPAAGRCRPAP